MCCVLRCNRMRPAYLFELATDVCRHIYQFTSKYTLISMFPKALLLDELLRLIFSFLDSEDLLSCKHACKQFIPACTYRVLRRRSCIHRENLIGIELHRLGYHTGSTKPCVRWLLCIRHGHWSCLVIISNFTVSPGLTKL